MNAGRVTGPAADGDEPRSDDELGAASTADVPRGEDVTPARRLMSRRSVLTGLGVGALAVGAGGFAAARGFQGSAANLSKDITIGLVTPLTGALAEFAAGDEFVVDSVRATPAYAKGFQVGGRLYKVNIVVADSRSNASWANQAAQDLIMYSNPDLILATSSPETVNPVADVCISQSVPCLGTAVPWEQWYQSLGGDPASPTWESEFATMFFLGFRQFQGCFTPMWERLAGGRDVACMFPLDADGIAFRAGMEPLITASGYSPVDSGAYPDGTTDYGAMIKHFMDCGLYTGAPLPADFDTFWRAAGRAGFRPRLATLAKGMQFPSDAASLGPRAANIAIASWWGPYLRTASSLTGQSAAGFASSYQAATGRPWIQTLGSTYSLFEVAREAFTTVSDPHDPSEVAAALHKVRYDGICGPLDFASGPAPGVAAMAPVGAQWKAATGQYPFELKAVDNSLVRSMPVQAPLEPTSA